MAWPCISRVCCLARFWNQLDKSDLSVPLTIQNYSDIAEHEVRSVAKQVCASERAHGGDCSPRGPADGPGPRGSCKTRREPSYKPRDDYHPGVPFPGVTQYKQDYKPWPIPRKEAFPWMSNGGGSVSDSPVRAEPAGSRGQRWEEESQTSSYRQEYRPWTGAKPAKSARKHAPAQYSSPGTETTHVPRETSYQAAYSGDVHRSLRLHHGEHLIPSAASNIQPAAVAQPVSNAPQPPSPPTLQQSVPPERTDLSGGNKAEDQLVRTKLPPNPSAVFQSGSRVSNI